MLSAPRLVPLIALLVTLVPGMVPPAHGELAQGPILDMYTATVPVARAALLLEAGLDVVSRQPVADGQQELTLVLSQADRRRLVAGGLDVVPWRAPSGETVQTLAAAQQEAGYRVWRPFDGSDGLLEHMRAVADAQPELAALRVLGTSVQGREIVALKVTANAPHVPDGARPAVLYMSGQHAREWIGLEVNRQLMQVFLDGYGVDPEVTELLDTRELWFLLAANPDGYQHTFDPAHRLWRKNLRDNDGDGRITAADGVDLNRNFPAHWAHDDVGSSPQPASETYRGAAPASEPETQAVVDLLDRVPFTFMVSYHSVAQLLLYPIGWMEHGRSADTGIFEALAGSPDAPAIDGYVPVPSWRLYKTNGETCDYAYSERRVLCFTPEMSDGGSGQGFVFPDDPELVARELAINLPFALDLARWASDPARAVSHRGAAVEPFVVQPFAVAHGDPQTVEVVAARHLPDVRVHWQVGDGQEQSAPTWEWAGGARYGQREAVHFRWLRGRVSGARPGDTTTVWFRSGRLESERFAYQLAVDSGAPVLVVAAEDYTGTWPTYQDRSRPTYLEAYLRALELAGIPADVYDVDAGGRTAPTERGVLSHYDAVIWYSGDDLFTTSSAEGVGTGLVVDRVPLETMLAVRDYVNDGGKLVVAGARAGQQFAARAPVPAVPGQTCEPRSGSGCDALSDDFFRYYLGGAEILPGLGVAGERLLHDVSGTDEPVLGLSFAFGERPADAVTQATGWVPSGRRPVAAGFPGQPGRVAARYEWPGMTPRSGGHHMFSDWQRYAWTSLTREIDLRDAESAELRLWVARHTAPELGWLFVEARTAGTDDWTTLRDENGHTVSDVGTFCRYRVQDWVHPRLGHYMTRLEDQGGVRCLASGTTGLWNAASGASRGWEEWRLDLSSWTGRRLDLAVSVLGSPEPGLGVAVDELVLTVDGRVEATSFADGLGGWAVAGPPPGSRVGGRGFARVDGTFVPAGPLVLTDSTVLSGFEFGHIADDRVRSELLSRLLRHLVPEAPARGVYLPLLYGGGGG